MNTPINEFSMPIFRNGDIGIPTESPHANETAVDIDLIHTIFILGLDAARVILGSNDRASAPITPPAPILPAAWPALANAGSPDGCDTQRGTLLDTANDPSPGSACGFDTVAANNYCSLLVSHGQLLPVMQYEIGAVTDGTQGLARAVGSIANTAMSALPPTIPAALLPPTAQAQSAADAPPPAGMRSATAKHVVDGEKPTRPFRCSFEGCPRGECDWFLIRSSTCVHAWLVEQRLRGSATSRPTSMRCTSACAFTSARGFTARRASSGRTTSSVTFNPSTPTSAPLVVAAIPRKFCS